MPRVLVEPRHIGSLPRSIELVPPAVKTDFTPGQSTRTGYMPLSEFIDEVMLLLQQRPTPHEILVQRVAFLRSAEAEGRFEVTVRILNETTSKAREPER